LVDILISNGIRVGIPVGGHVIKGALPVFDAALLVVQVGVLQLGRVVALAVFCALCIPDELTLGVVIVEVQAAAFGGLNRVDGTVGGVDVLVAVGVPTYSIAYFLDPVKFIVRICDDFSGAVRHLLQLAIVVIILVFRQSAVSGLDLGRIAECVVRKRIGRGGCGNLRQAKGLRVVGILDVFCACLGIEAVYRGGIRQRGYACQAPQGIVVVVQALVIRAIFIGKSSPAVVYIISYVPRGIGGRGCAAKQGRSGGQIVGRGTAQPRGACFLCRTRYTSRSGITDRGGIQTICVDAVYRFGDHVAGDLACQRASCGCAVMQIPLQEIVLIVVELVFERSLALQGLTAILTMHRPFR